MSTADQQAVLAAARQLVLASRAYNAYLDRAALEAITPETSFSSQAYTIVVQAMLDAEKDLMSAAERLVDREVAV